MKVSMARDAASRPTSVSAAARRRPARARRWAAVSEAGVGSAIGVSVTGEDPAGLSFETEHVLHVVEARRAAAAPDGGGDGPASEQAAVAGRVRQGEDLLL